MPDFKIDGDFLYVATQGDPEEVLRVKRLPGRAYDSERQAWRVPILPGLSKRLEDIYGYIILGSLLEDREAAVSTRLQPPAPGSVDPWKVSAGQAITLAVNYHFFTAHHGDPNDYARVHAPYRIGE